MLREHPTVLHSMSKIGNESLLQAMRRRRRRRRRRVLSVVGSPPTPARLCSPMLARPRPRPRPPGDGRWRGSTGDVMLGQQRRLSLALRPTHDLCLCVSSSSSPRRSNPEYTARKKSASRVELLLGAQCRFGMLVDPRGHSALQSALKNERKHVVWMLLQAISRSVSEQPRALQPFMRHRAEIASKCVAVRHPRVCVPTKPRRGKKRRRVFDIFLRVGEIASKTDPTDHARLAAQRVAQAWGCAWGCA